MHFEAIHLYLMASEYTHKLILLEQFFDRLLSKIIGALSLRVVNEITVLRRLVLHRVSPHQIAKEAVEWYLLESIKVVYFVNHV